MPSGGHGSRGGSSGGSSRGGFSGGSRGRSMGGSRPMGHNAPMHYGSRHYPHRHIRIRIGGHYYGYSDGGSPIVALLLFFIIFAGILAMGMGLNRGGIKDDMAYYEQQHTHYQEMIDYAKEHRSEGYIVKAIVTDRWQDPSTGKYSLDYEVKNGDIVLLKGYTYYCYTLAETTGLVGREIEIALDGVPITSTTDSIDLAFENVTLDEDADYISAKESLTNTTVVFAISLSVTILLTVVLVMYAVKKFKLEDDEEKPVENKTDNGKSYCSYCGSACSSSATRCPNCGANLR